MRAQERFRPQRLSDLRGQPAVVASLKAFLDNPYSTAMMFCGGTGTGKTTTAMILSECLGDNGWWGKSTYLRVGSGFSIEVCRNLFDADTTPFRFCVTKGKFHVLRIEELERLHPNVQNELKQSLEDAVRRYRLIVVATSNDTSRLEPALLHRFEMHHFLCGDPFADAINVWMPEVWLEVAGGRVPMPFGWETFGWDGESFYARLALDRLDSYAKWRKQGQEQEVV